MHVAAVVYELEILQEIFGKCARGKITTEEKNNNLLAEDYRGKADFPLAVK